MMPPFCSICFAPSGPEEIVYFKRTDAERREQEALRAAEGEGVTGHPSNASWFCALHYPEAAALAGFTSDEARKLMNGTRRFVCESTAFWIPTSLSLLDERTERRPVLDIPGSETRGHSWSWRSEHQRLFVQFWSDGVPHPGQPLEIAEQWRAAGDGSGASFASVGRGDAAELRAWFSVGDAHFCVVAQGFERRVFEALVLGAA